MKRSPYLKLPSLIFNSLVELQDGLNAMIDRSWRNVRTPDNWSLAITMETAELIDSYPWKWWKNISSEPDFNNIRIELVDIFHFSLSGAMMMKSIVDDKISMVTKKNLADSFTPFESKSGVYTTAVDGMIFLPLSNIENALASFRNIIHLANIYRFEIITEAVICAAHDLNMNLVAYYIAKHTLNYIRQLNGYKSGLYVKVKNDVEDNVILHSCIKGLTIDETLNEDKYVEVWNSIMCKVYDSFNVSLEDRRDIQYWVTLAKNQDSS
ncbi:unnamed protein product [Phytomonas sp. Hart1]|nr:unnamed protein product [Phytomonas sp. Hart1]|eukprot:CCW71211.1 unnamed protein product [Phytomonas sp. isolate Hart1]